MSTIGETSRLRLREIETGDAGFLCELMNEPAYLENIGDRGVRTPADAAKYIADKLRASYISHGYGLYLVETRAGGEAIGICGLVKREVFEYADIGFAFLQRYHAKGYATESADAVLHFAKATLRLPFVYGVVAPGNERSIRLLEKLGLRRQGPVHLPGQKSAAVLFARPLAADPPGV